MPRPATGSTNNVAADGSSWLAIEVVEWRPAWMLYKQALDVNRRHRSGPP
jgi:hypothetical protein